MRVTSIGLYANNVEVATFALRMESSKSRYMVRQIVGMDAEEITPKFYGFGLVSNAKFYDFSMKPRTIVIRVILNPTFALNEEYADVRDELYKAISATRSGKVEIRFYSSGADVASLNGFITKLEAGYFNKTPEAQLTIRCDDPVFRALNPVRLEPAELPVTNPVRIADSQSTIPHGFAVQVKINSVIPDFTIQDKVTNPDWKLKIIPSGGFLANDVLHISTDFNLKELYLTRASVRTYLIDRVEAGSIWPTLFPGVTEFYFVNINAFTWQYLEFYSAYWGV
jgi:hypothetical protein